MILLDEISTTAPEDAFSIMPNYGGPSGSFVVRVSVLDVSMAIPRGSSLDLEARTRAVTVIQDGIVIHTIPNEVRKNIAYRVGVASPSLVLEMIVSDEGEILQKRLRYAMVTPIVCLDIVKVEIALNDVKHPHHRKWHIMRDVVTAMAEFNGIDNIHRRYIDDTKSNILLSQLMTLSNIVITDMLTDASVPMIYRNQVVCGGTLFGDISEAFAFLGLENTPQLRVGFRKALKSMNHVSWCDVKPGGNEGVGVDQYSRFTSPLRDYANLVNFRCLCAFVLGGSPPYTVDELQEVADHFTALEQAKIDAKVGYFSATFLSPIDSEHVEYCVHGPLRYFLCLLREVLDGIIPLTDQIREIFRRRFALLSPAIRTENGEFSGLRLRFMSFLSLNESSELSS